MSNGHPWNHQFHYFPGIWLRSLCVTGCGAYESVIIRIKASPVQLNLPTGTELGKKKKKYMGLNHWILPKAHFKAHLFFSIFGWGDPSQPGSWSEGRVKPLRLSREAIWQVSEDPYHTEFVSWQVDHFSFFYFFELAISLCWGSNYTQLCLFD